MKKEDKTNAIRLLEHTLKTEQEKNHKEVKGQALGLLVLPS